MPRSPRADEAGGIYHALNRANFGALLITKTFWSLRSSSRHETLSGERIAKYNCVFAQSSSQRRLDVKLMFDNLVVFNRFFDLGAHR